MPAKLGAQCGEFELRQLDVVRKELDADYETSIATKTAATIAPFHITSSTRNLNWRNKAARAARRR